MPRAWFWVVLAASVAVLGYQQRQVITEGVQNMLLPRGVRNNNPGNIRHGSSRWQGMSAEQTDSNFVQFVSPEYGIRALSILLTNYYKGGLDTVRKIISKYAPSSENNTAAYANAVAKALGVSPDAVINLEAHRAALIAAIVQHENGQQPYTVAQINTGARMA